MNTRKNINLIVAIDNKNGISKNGNVPWHIKQDLQHFYRITTGTFPNSTKINAVIMGKNSWKTIPEKYRGLSKRLNIVISTTMTEQELEKDNNTNTPVRLARSLEDALKICYLDENIETIFMCGGAALYKEALEMNIIDRCYITEIMKDYKCDNFFPIDSLYNHINSKNMKFHDGLSKCINNEDDIQISFKDYTIHYDNIGEKQYLNLLRSILDTDKDGRETRNAPTYSIFGPQLEFDLRDGFPIMTTKRMFTRGIIEELLFFLKGDTNTNHLTEKKVNIWGPNTTREFLDNRGLIHYDIGDMGPMYGWILRHASANYTGMNTNYDNQGFDQLRDILIQLKKDPSSRRILMSTFDPSKVADSVLVPCHGLIIQFYVDNCYLDCKMYQRSADSFLGLPFNITSYALLMHILCEVTNYKPRKLILTFGDCHIYKDHKDVILEQLERVPYKFPQLEITKKYVYQLNTEDINIWVNSALSYIESLQFTDFNIKGYRSYPTLKGTMFA